MFPCSFVLWVVIRYRIILFTACSWICFGSLANLAHWWTASPWCTRLIWWICVKVVQKYNCVLILVQQSLLPGSKTVQWQKMGVSNFRGSLPPTQAGTWSSHHIWGICALSFFSLYLGATLISDHGSQRSHQILALFIVVPPGMRRIMNCLRRTSLIVITID